MFGLGPSALLGPDTPQGKAPSQLRAIPCLLRHAEREHCAARQENGLSPYIRVHAVFLVWSVMWPYLGLSAANLVFHVCLSSKGGRTKYNLVPAQPNPRVHGVFDRL